ncbi:PQQ-binding-like beta-propeller repeat protein [bacterium]|nr:PQQ-binding-like beta-propeller repeat protein [bacterium]
MLFLLTCISAHADQATDILEATGIRGGLVVHLGCGDGTLTAALHANERRLVHGLDTDPAHIAKARRHIRTLGLYGKVSVEQFAGARLPYADNLVNLVVAEDLGEAPMSEVMRVLAPRGVAYVKKGDGWQKTVKARPKEMDEWTHYLHDASNNAVAKDSLVGPPRRVQWVAGPRWARSHDHLSSTSALVSAAGRIFTIIDEGSIASVALPPRWFLVARDAFNGVLLWKRPIGSWEGHLRDFRSGPSELPRRLVAVGERVYVTLGYGKPVTALDAATGKTLATYAGTANAVEFIWHDGTLLVVVGDRVPDNVDGIAIPTKPKKIWHWWPIYEEKMPKKRLLAIRADSQSLLWSKDDADTADLLPTALAAAGRRVYLETPDAIVALDAASGKALWRTPRPLVRQRPSWSAPTLVVADGVVLSADRSTGNGLQTGQSEWMVDANGGQAPVGQLIALDAATGKKLWAGSARECYNAPADVLVAKGLVWTGSLVHSRDPGVTAALDLRTGQVARKRPADQKQFRIAMSHHRCYRNKATEKYLLLGRDGIEFIDVATGKGQAHMWVRGACQYGVMPCNGLVYAPPHSCACHIKTKLNSFNALAPAAADAEPMAADAHRLERGPGFDSAPDASPQTPDTVDWPTYRSDGLRSGCVRADVPASPTPVWTRKLGGRLSSVVVAGERVFVAQVDAHTVHALDRKTGKTLWTHTAGGRVDSPPTVYGGWVLFGCADGSITCLHITGELAWRFRVGTQDRRIVSYGQLESAWPIHGSVLAKDRHVYAVAGRSAYLDGGLVLYKLFVGTGKLISATRIAQGALPDVLSTDGTSLFMRHIRFDLDGVQQTTRVPHLFSPAGFLDGEGWHRTYWQVGTQMQSGWGAWPNAGNRVPAGRLLVSRMGKVYGFGRLNQYHRHGTHIGMGKVRNQLFSCDARPAKPAKPVKRGAPSKIACHWSRPAPVMPRAMLLAAGTLFVAGPPDVLVKAPTDNDHPYAIAASTEELEAQEASFSGGSGGTLLAVSASDGKTLSALKLDAPPVWDGMAAAHGRLYMATTDGSVVCLGAKE